MPRKKVQEITPVLDVLQDSPPPWLDKLKAALLNELQDQKLAISTDVDYVKVAELAAYECEDAEIAAVIGKGLVSFQKLKDKDPILQIAISLGQAFGSALLRKKQFNAAYDGNSNMLGHLGKHRLKQSEKQKRTDRLTTVNVMKLQDIKIEI